MEGLIHKIQKGAARTRGIFIDTVDFDREFFK